MALTILLQYRSMLDVQLITELGQAVFKDIDDELFVLSQN
jgi:hypothetical protein